MEFPSLAFRSTLRPSQADVMKIAKEKLAAGQRTLHVVAPPGSGKTVVGLYYWAELIKAPALVLSPNSAIQSQWAARCELFTTGDVREVASTDPKSPGWITSLTYQSVTLPQRADDDLDSQAIAYWKEKLVEDQQAEDDEQAQVWLDDLAKHNKAYYEDRLAVHRKVVRDAIADGGSALDILHASSRDTLKRLADRGVKLLIVDECHHLVGHWGQVLADAYELLGKPQILALTATPPDMDAKDPQDVERYQQFFGDIDYETPVPAVVKDGFLAPYQDLAYFVRPAAHELTYIAQTDRALRELVDELIQPPPAGVTSAQPQTSAPVETPTLEEPPKAQITVTKPQPKHEEAESSFEAMLDELQPVSAEPAKSNQEPDAKSADANIVETSDAETGEATESPTVEAGGVRLSLLDWLEYVLAHHKIGAIDAKNWSDFQRRDETLANAARIMLLKHRGKLPEGVPGVQLDLPLEQQPEFDYLLPCLDRYVRHYLRRSPRAEDRQLADKVVTQLRLLGHQITETSLRACASPVARVLAYSQNKTNAMLKILASEQACLGEKIRAVVITDFEKTSATSATVDNVLDNEAGGAVAAFRHLVQSTDTDGLDPILLTGSSVLVDDDLAPKFLELSNAWLQERKLDVSLELGVESGFRVVLGRGAMWTPRVYVELITDLFQQGVTRCLVGTRGLLGEGWDASKINVLVDLTTVTTSMTVRQLRGRSIRIDKEEPEKVANNWDVVCLAREFHRGLVDYERFSKKHRHVYGVTDDGAIEKGVGHVHAALEESGPESLEDFARALSEDAIGKICHRPVTRDLWKIGEPYQGKATQAVQWRPSNRSRSREKTGNLGFKANGQADSPWSASSLSLAIGETILRSLQETNQITGGNLQIGEREQGYVRMFLDTADDDASRLFADSLAEALGPLDNPRYVIPRSVERREATWISSWLPRFLAKHFEKIKEERVMLHAVPSPLATNREIVEIYQAWWNQLVGPGEALYARRGEGEELILEAMEEDGLGPKDKVKQQEVFR